MPEPLVPFSQPKELHREPKPSINMGILWVAAPIAKLPTGYIKSSQFRQTSIGSPDWLCLLLSPFYRCNLFTRPIRQSRSSSHYILYQSRSKQRIQHCCSGISDSNLSGSNRLYPFSCKSQHIFRSLSHDCFLLVIAGPFAMFQVPGLRQ